MDISYFTVSQTLPHAALVYLASVATAALLVRTSQFCRQVVAVEHVSRLEALDGLRGLLCLGVLLHHGAMHLQRFDVPRWLPPHSLFYEYLGRGAVALFFCLTGFLFWGRIRKSLGKLPLADFFRGRVLRIAPLYLVSAALCAGFVMADPAFRWVKPGELIRLAVEMSTLGILPWTPIYTPAGPINPSAANATVIWSLRYEWVFYFALPLLAIFIRRRLAWVIYGIALWSAVYFLTDSFAPKFMMFAVGMLAADLQQNPRVVRALNGMGGAGLVVISFVALLVFGQRFHSDVKDADIFFSGGATLLALGIFVPIACGNGLFGLLRLESLRLVGVFSYSVYLLHGTVLFVALPGLRRLADAPGAPNHPYWVGVAGCGVAVVLVSAVTYRFVELPFINLAHRLRTRRKQEPLVDAVAPASPVPTTPPADAAPTRESPASRFP